MLKQQSYFRQLFICALILTAISVFVSACANTPTLDKLLTLDSKRLSFVFFYTPG
jgi:hypothetical protein